MKKKDSSSSSERISAMLLGGSICSSDDGDYKGPLFARKKRWSFWKFSLLLIILATLWNLGAYLMPNSVGKVSKKVSKNIRGLASDYMPKAFGKKEKMENEKHN